LAASFFFLPCRFSVLFFYTFGQRNVFVMGIGGSEILVIILVALLLFGADKLPEIARGLGKGMREIKKATDDIKREFEESTREVRNDLNDVAKTIKSDVNEMKDTVGKEVRKSAGDINDNLKG
jgi:sec-independent protein translocase protein TatA